MLQQIVDFATSKSGVALGMAIVAMVTRIIEKVNLRKKGVLRDK